MAKFETRWPVGTTPRLVYSLALWLGNRRGDVAGLRWDQRCSKIVHIDGEAKEIDGFMIQQGKTGKQLFLPITPILAEMLAEGGASTRQIMDTLGHDDIAHAELYTREAEQARLATDGMSRVVRLKRNG